MKLHAAILISLIAIILYPTISQASDRCSYYFEMMEFEMAVEACTEAIDSTEKNSEILFEYYATRGLAYKVMGKNDEALSDFNSALMIDSDDKTRLFSTYNDRGNVYKIKGMYEEASSDFKKAIELNPESYVGTYYIASLFSLMKDADSACKWLRKTIENGFIIWKEAFAREEDLDNIRNAACYKEIMSGE
jgi:tetratricopeptide (TPR) repeat protein